MQSDSQKVVVYQKALGNLEAAPSSLGWDLEIGLFCLASRVEGREYKTRLFFPSWWFFLALFPTISLSDYYYFLNWLLERSCCFCLTLKIFYWTEKSKRLKSLSSTFLPSLFAKFSSTKMGNNYHRCLVILQQDIDGFSSFFCTNGGMLHRHFLNLLFLRHNILKRLFSY